MLIRNGLAGLLVLLLSLGFARAQSYPLQLTSPVRYLALGDSYTIGQSVPAPERWPVQLSDSLAVRGLAVDTTALIASTGWTTGSLLNAISGKNLDEKGFNLVSLLIGVNNQYLNIPPQVYRSQFKQLLDSCLAYVQQDTSSVFVVSIPDYAFTPFGNGNTQISGEIDFYNHINDSIAATYGITYFDITPISRSGLSQPELVASDGLHPSGLQYSLWVSLMLDYIDPTLTGLSRPPEALPVHLYPVPARTTLNVEGLPQGRSVELRIWSLSGKLLARKALRGEQRIRLDLREWPSGSYVLQVIRNGQPAGAVHFVRQ